jgi:mannose-6-phosphate isomerase-like protein (cupin superfamily)
MIYRQTEDFRWEGVPLQGYKNDGTTSFKDVTKQVLFAEPELASQLRYFEVQPGGYSSLERHAHVHAVMVVRGHGKVLVGDEVAPIRLNDLVFVPSMTWHQFQPDGDEPLGFLCLVNSERDRPQLPLAEDLAALRADPKVAEFIRV